jgi:hypothetical protein
MTVSNTIHQLGRSGMRGMLDGVRHHVGGRRSLWLVAGLALAAGLALKWDWLVAAGVAPVILSLLPCAAVCALGFCAVKATSPADPPRPLDADSEPNADHEGRQV